MNRLFSAVLATALSLGSFSNASSSADLQRRFSIAISGGASKGAYEAGLKCSHIFNVLDARGAFSVAERAASIRRIRRTSCRCAEAYLRQRENLGHPLLERADEPA